MLKVLKVLKDSYFGLEVLLIYYLRSWCYYYDFISDILRQRGGLEHSVCSCGHSKSCPPLPLINIMILYLNIYLYVFTETNTNISKAAHFFVKYHKNI